ncbi:MAG TPA: ATP-binding protein [Alphaproteobacteria bacterium]|nr:ATP-binding protein [Alphaproteobacteria bacterium]
MLNAGLLAAIAVSYLLILFALAYVVERQPDHGSRAINSSLVYTLSLASYCTSWTFYGSVGLASKAGIAFLPIYIGPTLAFTLGWLLLRKILRVSKVNRITSIASLIASRFGKSAGLGALVTVVAVIGAVPYLALQLKAVSTSFLVLTHDPDLAAESLTADILKDAGLWAAVLLTLFAMLFGSRSIQPGEHHQGMVAAVALESLVKLLCFAAVGLFVGYGLFDGFGDLFRRAAAVPALTPLFAAGDGSADINWVAYTIVSFAAVICLERQFQVMVVENVDERHLDRAMWLFPLYLFAINLFVLPIALAGRLLLPSDANPDTIVLAVPIAAHHTVLAAAVFIGGLSASAGMIIVSTTALSTMVCNDLVMPTLLRLRPAALESRGDVIPLLLSIRRWAMVAVMALGYLYMRYVGEGFPLVSIGLLSFNAVAQFFPALLLGLFWPRATRLGAAVGISAGFVVWAYTLLLPTIAHSGLIPAAFVAYGLFGVSMLKPYALFGLTGLMPIAHSLFWSMLFNIGGLIGVSLLFRPAPPERAQAALFVDIFRGAEAAQLWRRTARLPDLRALIGRFLGHRQAEAAFLARARERGLDPATAEADAETVLLAEQLLAGAIGTASAQVLVQSVVKEEPLGLDEIMRILDETSRIMEYNRRLEEKSVALEAAGEELRRANDQLKELDRLKDDFISTVNHELRTPLTSIRSFSEILRDNPELDPARRAEFYQIIVRESERLTRLIGQMLDLAKIQSGQITTAFATLDIAAVLREAATATGQMFRDKGVALDLALGIAPLVETDRDLVTQVVLNLLSNAAKCSPAGHGRVSVSIATVEPGWVDVAVRDNGPGVAPEFREVIFERFRQIGDPLTDKPVGTGLGLAISRMIMARLGGSIWVEDAPGGGALFKLRLPLRRAGSGRPDNLAAE